jgi:hypothetical protein
LRPGGTYVAFAVDDIAAAKAELESRGVEFYADVNVVDDGVLAGSASLELIARYVLPALYQEAP